MRVSLNDLDWLGNQIIRFIQIRFSGKAVCVVFVVLVGSHSSELKINHRLFFYIYNSFIKFLENFESLSQGFGLVGKPDHSVHSD